MVELFLDFSKLIIYVGLVISLFALIVYRRLNPVLKPLALYLVASGCFDYLSYLFARSNQNNLQFTHLFSMLEIVLVSMFFYRLYKLVVEKVRIKEATIIILVLIIANALFLQSPGDFNSYSAMLVNFCIIAYSLYSFYLMLEYKILADKVIFKWCVIGLFLYNMVDVVINLSTEVIFEFEKSTQVIVWFSRAIIIILSKLIITGSIAIDYFSSEKG